MSSSSTNEEISKAPPQHRVSPLDFRNTDLVSRLLAATPPYLYNMPMVPNSYFFSELLRSFVHAKTERMNNNNAVQQQQQQQQQQQIQHQRKPRKRSWTQSSSIITTTAEKADKLFSPLLTSSVNASSKPYYDNKSKILELNDSKHGHDELIISSSSSTSYQNANSANLNEASQLKQQQQQQQQENAQNLILPPPPPVWYPPLFHPTAPPYDPLHFFIDLRVSGHIYDRNNKKIDRDPTNEIEPILSKESLSGGANNPPPEGGFKLTQSRHTSAFSVPNKHANQNPINLSKNTNDDSHKPLKFDVKSIVEKHNNKTGVNYVLSNVDRVYKELNIESEKVEKDVKRERDLKALIGLELVVDYMAHKKSVGNVVGNCDSHVSIDGNGSFTSTTDNESNRVDSPTLEVVDDNSQRDYT